MNSKWDKIVFATIFTPLNLPWFLSSVNNQTPRVQISWPPSHVPLICRNPPRSQVWLCCYCPLSFMIYYLIVVFNFLGSHTLLACCLSALFSLSYSSNMYVLIMFYPVSFLFDLGIFLVSSHNPPISQSRFVFYYCKLLLQFFCSPFVPG